MGGKIPEPIRRKVLRQWLEGTPRRQIARDNQIGTGTVSEIIKAIKEIDSEARIDALRETAVILRRESLNIDTLLESIRLKQILEEIGLKGEKLEDFARQLEIHCFKRGLTRDTFMNLVANMSSLSDSLGIPVEELPESIKSSKELLNDTNVLIKNRSLILKRVNESYNVTITELEEYRRNRPLIETLKAKNLELEKARKQIFDLKAELFKRQYEWSASSYEHDVVNIELKPPIKSAELYNLAKELYLHPSKHVDVIRTMRQRPGPKAALVDTNKVNIFNRPLPTAHTPTTLLFLPSGTPICRTGTATPNPTQITQSELLGLLKGVNPVRPVNLTGANPATSTTTTTQPTNTLPFSNSNPNPQPPLQNTTTAITLAPPPSASITSSAPRTLESDTTSTPSTPSNQQTITRGCGQGTDNSTCRPNPNPPPTLQNTTTNLVGDCNANPNLQKNVNNNQSPDSGKENNNNGG
jgi:hypothetical protein